MTCEEAQGKITSFINDQLAIPELEEFVSHIRNCPVCKEELEVYYALMTAMKQLDAGSDLSDNYMMELEAKLLTAEGLVRRSKRAHKSRRQMFFLLLFCVVFLTGVSASFGDEEEGPQSPQTFSMPKERSFVLGDNLFYEQNRNLVEEWKQELLKEGGSWPPEKKQPYIREDKDTITGMEKVAP